MLLFATMAFHAFFGVALTSGDTLLQATPVNTEDAWRAVAAKFPFGRFGANGARHLGHR